MFTVLPILSSPSSVQFGNVKHFASQQAARQFAQAQASDHNLFVNGCTVSCSVIPGKLTQEQAECEYLS